MRAWTWYSKLKAFRLFVSTPLLETSTGQTPIDIAGVTHLISDEDIYAALYDDIDDYALQDDQYDELEEDFGHIDVHGEELPSIIAVPDVAAKDDVILEYLKSTYPNIVNSHDE